MTSILFEVDLANGCRAEVWISKRHISELDERSDKLTIPRWLAVDRGLM
jgi:hypothetical protein